MFTCDFSKKGNLTLSEYLYQNLKSAIIDGNFAPNEKLPSKKSSDLCGIRIIIHILYLALRFFDGGGDHCVLRVLCRNYDGKQIRTDKAAQMRARGNA